MVHVLVSVLQGQKRYLQKVNSSHYAFKLDINVLLPTNIHSSFEKHFTI